MTRLLRFPDLQERVAINNRTSLGRAIDKYGFPPGRLITPKCRVWTEDEVDAWLATRPVKHEKEVA